MATTLNSSLSDDDDWEDDDEEFKNFLKSIMDGTFNLESLFRESISWEEFEREMGIIKHDERED